MFKFLVNRPIGVLVSFVALIFLGLAAGQVIPTSLLPEVDIPDINVHIDAKNLSAREIEERITSHLRTVLQQTGELENIESISHEGAANIKLSFSHNMDMSTAFILVNEKIDMLMNRFPKEIERPQVTRSTVADIPVFHLQIKDASENTNDNRFSEIGSFINNVLRRRLEQLPEISMVDISGYEESQILLEPKIDRMSSLGIDNSALISVFDQNNINLGNVQVINGHYRYYIKFVSNMNDIDQISNFPLKFGGRIFKLSDLVQVTFNVASSKGLFYNSKGRAIDLAIIKQSNSKIENLQTSFNSLIAKFKIDYPDLEFTVTQDQTSLLDYAVGNLKQDLFLGGILAFICMLIFIRKWKAAILIGITIPVTLILVQIGFFLSGISFNILSLGGLILGLGMIIDNSIVVIDTINLHQTEGKDLEESVIAGPSEIVIPLLSSVLTNCAVFLPLLFLSGIAGAIFYDQALSVTIGVLTSMLVSIILLPPLFLLIHRLPFKIKTSREIKERISITELYNKGIDRIFQNKGYTFFFIFLVFLCGIFSFLSMNKQRLPELTRNDMHVNIDWNMYIPLDSSIRRINKLLEPFSNNLVDYNVWLGQQQYLLSDLREIGLNEVKIYLKVRKPEELSTVSKEIAKKFKHFYPHAILEFEEAPNAFDAVFSEREAPLILQIRDNGSNKIPELAIVDSIQRNILVQFPGITIPSIAREKEIILTTDVEKATLYGVSQTQIRLAISEKLKATYVGQLQSSETSLPIRIGYEAFDSVRKLLSEVTVRGQNGQSYALDVFVSTKTEENHRAITAMKFGEYYPMQISGGNPVKIASYVADKFENPLSSISVRFSGNYFSTKILITEMSYILMISVLLLYFILAAQFESLIQPLFILAELPIAIMGAVIALYVAGSSINLMSMIGIVIMSGLVINDSILKIDAINKYRKKGFSLMDSIHKGGVRRLKPMVMITMTSVGAMLPTLFMNDLGSELQKPLALALLGGMTVGLFVSLFFVPLIYWLVYNKKEDC